MKNIHLMTSMLVATSLRHYPVPLLRFNFLSQTTPTIVTMIVMGIESFAMPTMEDVDEEFADAGSFKDENFIESVLQNTRDQSRSLGKRSLYIEYIEYLSRTTEHSSHSKKHILKYTRNTSDNSILSTSNAPQNLHHKSKETEQELVNVENTLHNKSNETEQELVNVENTLHNKSNETEQELVNIENTLHNKSNETEQELVNVENTLHNKSNETEQELVNVENTLHNKSNETEQELVNVENTLHNKSNETEQELVNIENTLHNKSNETEQELVNIENTLHNKSNETEQELVNIENTLHKHELSSMSRSFDDRLRDISYTDHSNQSHSIASPNDVMSYTESPNQSHAFTSPSDVTSYTESPNQSHVFISPSDVKSNTETPNQSHAFISPSDVTSFTESSHQSHFYISSSDITDCMNLMQPISLTALKATISLSLNNISNGITGMKATWFRPLHCSISITSQNGQMLYVQYRVHELSKLCEIKKASICIYVDEITPNSVLKRLSVFPQCHQWMPLSFFSSQGTIIIKIELSGDESFPLMLIFIQAAESGDVSRPHLQVTHLTSLKGYVQSPGFGRESEDLPVFEDWAELKVPHDHMIMWSFRRYFSPAVCLQASLRVEGFTNSEITFHSDSCDYTWSLINVYQGDKVRITAKILKTQLPRKVEFELLFSFHEKASLPEKLITGKWNCSVPYFNTFQDHVMCNLERECENGEDEAVCPYLNAECGENIAFAGHCYVYARSNFTISWGVAAEKCTSFGGYLASFNSIKEWQGIVKILSMGRLDVNVYVGLKAEGYFKSHELYGKTAKWVDNSIAYYAETFTNLFNGECSLLPDFDFYPTLETCNCLINFANHFMCELNAPGVIEPTNERPVQAPIQLFKSPNWSANISSLVCRGGHRTHEFLACHDRTSCLDDSQSLQCVSSMQAFVCNNPVESIPYTLVCDCKRDCQDGSDENFCELTSDRPGSKKCHNGQCISKFLFCNGQKECDDGSDEFLCHIGVFSPPKTSRPPFIVFFNTTGYHLEKWTAAKSCPETHFPCPDGEYCLPVFVRCNDVNDCPDHADEADCDVYTCPGFYRCRASRVCLHARHLCDGVFQCPQHDDEMLCQLMCPVNCTCSGLSFTCTGYFQASDYPELRYLDSGGHVSDLENLLHLRFLVYLSFARSDLRTIPFLDLPNLRILDLSHNKITTLNAIALQKVGKLQTLRMTGNPLIIVSQKVHANIQHNDLHILDLSFVGMIHFDTDYLQDFPNLNILNLSFCGIRSLNGTGFGYVRNLRIIDLRGNPISEFPVKTFHNLHLLENIYADTFKLCCPDFLPAGFKGDNCFAPVNELSSCDDLLQATEYRICLWFFASLAIVGNSGSFVYRTFLHGNMWRSGFSLFVTNLSVADFLTGVYLTIVGAADLTYRGMYVYHDIQWRHSSICHLAGALSFLSNKVSAFFICLITIDRFLVVHFPLSHLRFQKWSALLACSFVWILGICLSIIPLVPVTSHWQFYSQTSICIPLPITRATFPGRQYSFGIMIVLDFILFLLIALGQVSIFVSIRGNAMTFDTTRKSNDSVVARRLLSIVMANFLCWFPIGLLGLLSSVDIPIPGEINVGIAIFVLPLNSVLNPFLYTLNILQEKHKKVREKAIIERLRTK